MGKMNAKQRKIDELRNKQCEAMDGDCSSCEMDKCGICDISPSNWNDREMDMIYEFCKKKGHC